MMELSKPHCGSTALTEIPGLKRSSKRRFLQAGQSLCIILRDVTEMLLLINVQHVLAEGMAMTSEAAKNPSGWQFEDFFLSKSAFVSQ